MFNFKTAILNKTGKIDWKINLYSLCIGCSFKTFATIDEHEISNSLKEN